jgi:hypothetical protein
MQTQTRETTLCEIKDHIKKNKIARYHLGEASLAEQESSAMSRLLRKQIQANPDRPARVARTKNPAKAPPLHRTATQVTYQCDVEPTSD